jgi:hypothetical protein
MLFKATETQVKKVAREALKACGVEMPLKDIPVDRVGKNAGLVLSSIGGKAVNLELRRQSDFVWYTPDKEPVEKKQAWAKTFPSYEKLLATVEGIKIFGLKPAKTVEQKKAEKEAAKEAAKTQPKPELKKPDIKDMKKKEKKEKK